MELAKECVLRLLSIEVSGLKNVRKGTIYFPEGKPFLKGNFEKHSGVLGIYGQNGSGKTTIIDALFVLKSLLSGISLNEQSFLENLLNIESKYSSIIYNFRLDDKSDHYLLKYCVYLKKDFKNNKVCLSKEMFSCKRFNYSNCQFETYGDEVNLSNEITPISDFDKNILNSAIDFFVDKKLLYTNGRSAVLSIKFIEKHSSLMSASKDILSILRFFSTKLRKNLFCYNTTNDALAIMGAGTAIGESVYTDDVNHIAYGTFPFNTRCSFEINKKHYDLYQCLLDQINLVVSSFVPGFNAEYKQIGEPHLSKNGKDEMITLEMVRVINKEKGKYIPISAESNGVKKFINLASAILCCFNNASCILAIDELDSGVFEDLLEQFLYIMNDQGKGQLIFSSHNLSALEVLSTKSIYTTTTNPKNRYIQLSKVKPTNNFRNFYLNALKVGGQKEQIINRTEASAISRSLRIGRRIFERESFLDEDEN